MHNAAFQALGMNAAYVPFPVLPQNLPEAALGLARAGVGGFNLTVPHKLAILPLLHETAPQARAIGAVNTVRCDGENMTGTNTDGEGFLLSLAHDLQWHPEEAKRVLLLGAGCAARGIAVSLLEAGVNTLLIANRTQSRAEELAAHCRTLYPESRVETLGMDALQGSAPHLLVNATTVGMGDGKSPLQLAGVGLREAVIDIVYTPPETPLLAEARGLGLRAANGLEMLLYQGWLAFRFLTGREAPLEVMREAMMAGLKEREG